VANVDGLWEPADGTGMQKIAMERHRDRTIGSQWMGRPILRIDDEALLRGRGRFIDDFEPANCLHLQFLRSTVPSGRIRSIDASAACAAPGVVGVFTGADTAALGRLAVNPLIEGLREPRSALLAVENIDAVGQPLAAVVATSVTTALDAVEMITVEVDEGSQRRVDPGDVFSKHWTAGDVEAAFSRATHVVHIHFAHSRLAPAPLETRRTLVFADPDRMITAWIATQAPHRARVDLARVIGIPEDKVRVIAPDIGGAFGCKASLYPEDVVVAFAALRLGKPVKWCSSRSEEFLSATQGRGALAENELAVDSDGRFIGLRARFAFPLGSWLPFSAVVPARNAGRILPGPYAIENVDFRTAAKHRRSRHLPRCRASRGGNAYGTSGRASSAGLPDRSSRTAQAQFAEARLPPTYKRDRRSHRLG
jgi:carbon-monoxide dehydrogenase large subunit